MPRPGFPADIGVKRGPRPAPPPAPAHTPLQPAAHMAAGLPPAESARWKTLLDALLPERPIELSKQSDMVRLTRSYEPDEDGTVAPIWTKTYQKAGRGDTPQVDLSVFNAWERTLIMKAHEDGLESCYRLYQLYEKGTGLHFGDTPVELRRSRSTVIKTHHAGPDLDQWRLMRPWSRGMRLDHPFVLQQHFLKLVRGILVALHGFHSKRFVHCDLHPGNIVLPAEVKPLPAAHGEGERYQLVALWDRIKLIDLGYSVHKGIEPPAMPPLALWEMEDAQGRSKRDAIGQRIASRRMSPHLHSRLMTLDAIAAAWPASERYHRHHWEKHQQQLDILRSLDWREDLYQLGYWLARMRDGDADGSWGGVHYLGDPVDVREVNEFIRDFPQELMDWGVSADLPAMPHVDYIRRIDTLLLRLPAVSDAFVLHRREHDTAYKTYLDVLAHRRDADADTDAGARAHADAAADAKAEAAPDASSGGAPPAIGTRLEPQPTAPSSDPQSVPGPGPARAAVRALAALAGLAGLLVLGWLGWPHGSAAPDVPSAARSNTPAAPAMARPLAAGVVRAQPASAPAAAPATTATAATTAATAATTTPVAAPVATPAAAAPSPGAVDDGNAQLAAYRAATDAIEHSAWWRNGRSTGLAADAEQTAWVRDTLAHARGEQWPRAQFALAGLYCSGAHPPLAALSASRCGAWLSTALANPQFRSAATPPEERQHMVDEVIAAFDDLVFGYWQGKFRDASPNTEFAAALLPGMQALQDSYPGLALRAAHVQACYLRPVQRAAAQQTLRAVVARHPGTPEATQARRWLAESRGGDYGHCKAARS